MQQIEHNGAWDHLLKHKLTSGGKKNSKICFMVWVAVVWVIWVNRNRVVFKGGLPNVNQMLHQVQGVIWGWIANRVVDQRWVDFEDWINNPLASLKLLC